MIRFICVVVFLILFLILTIPVFFIEWLIGKFNRNARDYSCLRIVQWGFKAILKVTGVHTTVIGFENIPDEPVLFIGNHRSFFDILLTYSRCPRLTGYVAKKEMEKIPLLSTWMRFVYCLFLDRENPKEGLKTILQAIDYVKQGISTVSGTGTRAAPRLYRRGFRRNLHDAAAAVRAGDLCVLSGRGVLSQYVPECQGRFSGIL